MKKDDRVSKTDYYLGIAREVAKRSPCSRRKFGAVIVKDNTIVATGYNGTMPGALNCGIDIPCIKDVAKEPSYLSYDYCPSIHAEENACIAAGKERATGGTLYLSPILGVGSRAERGGDRPCFRCRRSIRRAGLKRVVFINKEGNVVEDDVTDYVELENQWMIDKLDGANPDWMDVMME